MVFGHNTSAIDEEFPTPTPVPPGKSVVKKVKIRNGKLRLPAIFVRHLYSVNELKRLRDLIRKTGLKEKMTTIITKNRFQKAKARRNCLPESALQKKWNRKNLRFQVYEESVQIEKGNMVFHGYREAWDAYERGGQT